MILRNRIFIVNVKVKSVAYTDAELLGKGEERKDRRQWVWGWNEKDSG